MLTVDGGSTASYVYDASGRRVQKTVGSNTVNFAYDLRGHIQAEYTPATVNRFEVYQPDNGKHLVTYSASRTFFDLQDFVGSERVKTTQDGTYEASANLPFGDSLFSYGPALGLAGSTHFTGMDTDSETGLSHAWFRQLSTTQGRWMTPDPAGMAAADPTNPQSWNRYAYVMNSPLNNIDPLGLDTDCIGYECLSQGHGGTLCNGTFVPSSWGNGEFCFEPGRYVLGNQCQPILNAQGRFLGDPCISSVVIFGGNTGPSMSAGNTGTRRQSCTALQAEASKLAGALDKISSTSGWTAFGTGTITLLAGVAEVPTGGLDTPGTITAGAVTDFFATVSLVTGGVAATLNSFASGNTGAVRNFDVSQLTNIAAKAAASRLPLVKPWADRIGDLAEQAADLAMKAQEGGCQ